VKENVRATPLKNWCNFKHFNTILNSEILLNLRRKIKYLKDQFQLRVARTELSKRLQYVVCIVIFGRDFHYEAI